MQELRQRAPDFKAELDGLRQTVARQAKLITRLRTEQSILGYQQTQLDAQLQKSRREVSLTAVRMTAFGEQTSEVLRHLCQEAGFDLTGVEYERPN